MRSDVAISVVDVSKCYRLYNKPIDRLKDLLSWGASSKRYRLFWALRNISFEVKRGETVGVVGRNGSGKSTLLQMICGVLNTTGGSIEINGRVAALLELGAGFNPEFTGRENVYLNGAILGLTKREVDERFDAIVRFSEIGEFIDQPVKTYSSGMYVRLAFSVQANVDPDVLIVDEALSVGDAKFVQKCMHRINQLRENGTTILFVSHDATAVRTLCTKAIWLDQGSIAKCGDASEVVDYYLASLSNQAVVQVADSSKLSDRPENGRGGSLVNDSFGSSLRFGDQKCVFESAYVLDENGKRTEIIQASTTISLMLEIVNYEMPTGQPLILGYSLRNFKGVDIASGNSEDEEVVIPAPKIGEKGMVKLEMKLPLLHPGTYSFRTALSHRLPSGDIVNSDDVVCAATFELVTDKKIYVLMGLDTKYIQVDEN